MDLGGGGGVVMLPPAGGGSFSEPNGAVINHLFIYKFIFFAKIKVWLTDASKVKGVHALLLLLAVLPDLLLPSFFLPSGHEFWFLGKMPVSVESTEVDGGMSTLQPSKTLRIYNILWKLTEELQQVDR